MAAHSTKRVIFAALAGNSLIAVTKFTAAAFTGSSAMFSEAIHSTVDTGNQGLLLYGLRRANQKADAQHPFGYSQEIYFWAFVVAILVFAVGAGVSVYEGVHKVLHPTPVVSAYINYIVLGLAMIFEGFAWAIAFKEFNARRGRRSYLRAIQEGKDPSILTVLLEDTAAMLGLFVAFLGVFLSQALGMPILDGAASIAIGFILAMAALLLALETKSLLIGEAASPETLDRIQRVLVADKNVFRVNEVLTMHLGPYDVLATLSVDFHDTLDARDIETTVDRLERAIRQACPEVTRIFIEAQSWRSHQILGGGDVTDPIR